MSTTMPKVETIDRKWYVLDAEGQSLGRVAAKAAHILRGKHKPTFAPHCDCGDHVIIINCAKAVLTGKKLEKKFYRWHTGWIGGLKEIKYADLMKNTPEKAMMIAVKGMLPDTTLGRTQLRRLRVYKDAQHENAAQKPEAYTL
jgi:large subunit ribosomal protein L13